MHWEQIIGQFLLLDNQNHFSYCSTCNNQNITSILSDMTFRILNYIISYIYTQHYT